MSNEKRKPRFAASAPRLSASLIVRPNTNCPPKIRIAVVIAWRMMGSPLRSTSLPNTVVQSCVPSPSLTTWPVSISAQVDALTNTDED